MCLGFPFRAPQLWFNCMLYHSNLAQLLSLYFRELEDLEREEEEADKVLILTQRTFEKCKCCKMYINGPYQVKYPK